MPGTQAENEVTPHLTVPAAMTNHKWIAPLCLSWCVSLQAAPVAEPDWGDDKPLPIPSELQGLWAQGRHCDDPRRQLRVTKLTMQFGTHKPVRPYYMQPDEINSGGGALCRT